MSSGAESSGAESSGAESSGAETSASPGRGDVRFAEGAAWATCGRGPRSAEQARGPPGQGDPGACSPGGLSPIVRWRVDHHVDEKGVTHKPIGEVTMNKLIYIAVAVAAASGVAATPAIAGLSGNTSFSHQLRVHAPSGAQPASVDDHSLTEHGRSRGPSATPSASKTVEPGEDRVGEVEPGDDRGAAVEPGDDKGLAVEPGDDRGAAVEPGDDKGLAVEPGDDKGGVVPQPAPAPTTAVRTVDDHGGASSNGQGGHDDRG
jgi:hypothetical protein